MCNRSGGQVKSQPRGRLPGILSEDAHHATGARGFFYVAAVCVIGNIKRKDDTGSPVTTRWLPPDLLFPRRQSPIADKRSDLRICC